MTNKRYPTRMHEVLGVETGEIFTINEDDYGFYHTLDCDGQIVFTDPEDAEEYRITADMVTSAINHGITRRPRLTDEQVAQLKALVTLGYRWLIKDSTDAVFAYTIRPAKQSEWWNCGGANVRIFIDLPPGILTSLVSWSDPEPLDIVATLKSAGVEVE